MADSPGCRTYEACACLASSNGWVSASAVSYMTQLRKPRMLRAMRLVYRFQPARSSEMAPSIWSSSPGMAAREDTGVNVGCGEGRLS
jgi:hypothetical protein